MCANSWIEIILINKSSSYKRTLREKNLQLADLQLYIKNIARCLGKLDFISVRIKYHQWNVLIKCSTQNTSWLYINHKNFQQYVGIHSQPTSKSTLFLIMYPYANTWYKSNENITPSPDATTDLSYCLDKILDFLKQSNEDNRNCFEIFKTR